MSFAGGLRELLRPPPHRGPLIAAGAVVLAVGVAVSLMRVEERLAVAVSALILLVAGALIFWLGAQAPNEDGVPPAYQSVLLATGLPLVYAGLIVVAAALGADFGDELPPGALMWTSAVAGALALWPALERHSAISLLFAAILGGVALLSAWGWLFDSETGTAYRWLLAIYAAALVLASLPLREPARRHAEVLIDAAGLAIVSIALTSFIGPVEWSGLSWLWEAVILGAGFGLVAFGALDRSPGPAYLGVANLASFVFIVGDTEGETLYVWPVVLLVAGVAMLAAGLRPRRPLPPEPSPYRAGEAPLAARADDGEIVVRVRDDS
jgi:hypothetical protein